jgi:hypothetical protein
MSEPAANSSGGASEEPNGFELIPSLARVTASSVWHAGTWAAGAYVKAGQRAIGVILKPETGPELAREVIDESLRVFHAVFPGAQLPGLTDSQTEGGGSNRSANRSLRAGGEELLRRSRDVRYEENVHPAYERILGELAPDEARVLRLLLVKGPQAAVDVRTGGPIGLIRSHLIAPGLSMIGPRAGCRYVERVPSYLNNLYRLGLIWFSHETLRDHRQYQVLEAQPDVLGAIHSVSAARVVRRSIHLTPFGEDFARICLIDPGESITDLPEHSSPKEGEPKPPTEVVEG